MIVGHKISKINVEVGDAAGRVEIKTNVNIDKIEKKDFFVAAEKKPGLNIDFNFVADYGGAGKININGSLFYVEDKKIMDELEKQWKKDKKVDNELMVPIINRAMNISYVEAIIIADRVRLPSPLRMPRVTPKTQ
jgi:hypothetical protein